jgi:hypothetical protein
MGWNFLATWLYYLALPKVRHWRKQVDKELFNERWEWRACEAWEDFSWKKDQLPAIHLLRQVESSCWLERPTWVQRKHQWGKRRRRNNVDSSIGYWAIWLRGKQKAYLTFKQPQNEIRLSLQSTPKSKRDKIRV